MNNEIIAFIIAQQLFTTERITLSYEGGDLIISVYTDMKVEVAKNSEELWNDILNSMAATNIVLRLRWIKN